MISTGWFGRLFPSNVLFRPCITSGGGCYAPHRLGRSAEGQPRGSLRSVVWRKRERSAACWLTVILAFPGAGEARQSGVACGFLANGAPPLPYGPLHSARRHRCRGSARARPTVGTTRKIAMQMVRELDPECGDGMRAMPLGSEARPAAGNRAATGALIIQQRRRVRRGKNGSAPLPGTHRRQCTNWRDGETRASLFLRNGRVPVLVSIPRNPVR